MKRKIMKKPVRRIVVITIVILILLGLGIGYKKIRHDLYPVQVDPSPGWGSFVSELNAEILNFPIDLDGTNLEAELFLPEGGRSIKPAVVFSPGSGDSLYQNYAEGMIETYILELFLSRDMAVLLVNKRGMGESEGDYTRSSISGRANDLNRVVELLRQHRSIDPANVGLIGHSEGGWVVAQAAAEDPEIAFVISLAGPTIKRIEQAIDMYKYEAICQGLTGEEAEKHLENRLRWTRIGTRIGESLNWGLLGFDARTMSYDPAEAIQKIKSPTLYAYAENDILVIPSVNIERMENIFNGSIPANIEVVVADKATHIYRLVDAPCESWDDPATKPQSTQLIDQLNEWLKRQGY